MFWMFEFSPPPAISNSGEAVPASSNWMRTLFFSKNGIIPAPVWSCRHCERSEAIHLSACCTMDCFVASPLAMTILRHRAQFLCRLPVAPVIVRHLDMRRAEERERVVDGIGEGRHAADIRAFADALGTDRMMRRRGDGEVGFPMRRLHCGRHEEIHERAGDDVAGVIVADFLAHRDGKRLGEAAMH